VNACYPHGAIHHIFDAGRGFSNILSLFLQHFSKRITPLLYALRLTKFVKNRRVVGLERGLQRRRV
jgi:hypothetical protein